MTKSGKVADQSNNAAEKYLRDEIQRVDRIPLARRSNADFYKRNILFYAWLLQRESFGAELSTLALLIGIPQQQLDDLLHDLLPFIEGMTERAVRLTDSMMIAVETVFNDPLIHYNISGNVPFLGRTPGYEFIKYINDLAEPYQITFSNLVMDAFRIALPGVVIEKINDDLPHIGLVSGPNHRWYFILCVLPNKGPLDLQGIRNLTADLWFIHGDLHEQGYDNLNILIMTSNINNAGKQFIGKRQEMHHLWGLSSLRFFHLLKDLIEKYDDRERSILADNFHVIFSAQKPSTTFSIRDAFNVLQAVIEGKSTRPSGS